MGTSKSQNPLTQEFGAFLIVWLQDCFSFNSTSNLHNTDANTTTYDLHWHLHNDTPAPTLRHTTTYSMIHHHIQYDTLAVLQSYTAGHTI